MCFRSDKFSVLVGATTACAGAAGNSDSGPDLCLADQFVKLLKIEPETPAGAQ